MHHPRRVGGLVGRAGSVAVAVVAAAALAACSGPGSSAPDTSAAAAPESVSTSIGSAPVSLTLYDGQGLQKLDDALIAGFQKQYPNVTIKPTYDPDKVTTQNQPRLLASDTPPDLVRVISVTDGVKNNLLTNLDAYAEGVRVGPAACLAAGPVPGDRRRRRVRIAVCQAQRFHDDRALLQQETRQPIRDDDQPPASIDELTTLFGKIKAGGQTPLMASNSTGWSCFAAAADVQHRRWASSRSRTGCSRCRMPRSTPRRA